MVLKDTEKVAAGALRQTLQTWLAPQLSGISERLTRIEGEMTGLKAGVAALRGEMQAGFRSVDDRIDAMKERLANTNQRIGEAMDIR